LVKPYTDDGNIRVFSEDVIDDELVWHRDEQTRVVTVLEGTGWSFQRDNELPIPLYPGNKIYIEAYEYHRIIKGQTDLKIKIEEN